MDSSITRRPSGRPPKFPEPSGPVTVTLPFRTIESLKLIDNDRAKAIVKAVDAATNGNDGSSTGVVEIGPDTGLVVVPNNSSLRALPWLRLVEVSPGRHILVVSRGTPIERVELALMDLIEEVRDSRPAELPLLEMLRDKISELRRDERISTEEILLVAL